MKPLVLIPVCLLMFSSCAVLRDRHSLKSDSLNRSDLDITQHTTLDASSRQQRLLLVSDSSDHWYTAEIIPTGPFHYSPSEGFTGSASRITVRGRIQKVAGRRDSSVAGSTLQAGSVITVKEQQLSQGSKKVNDKEVERSMSFWGWLLLGIVIVAGGGFVFKRFVYNWC